MIPREKSQKLYSQVYDILRKEIRDGKWQVDSQIPTEDKLCLMYGVSKATIRLALSELARQGYLRRMQGKGTFVCKRTPSEGLRFTIGLGEFMLEAGINFSTKVLAQTVMMPTDDLDTKMNVSMVQHLVYIRRLRMAEDEPVLIQESFVPYHVCPLILKENVENESVINLLEKHGITITKVKSYLDTTYLNAEESGIFGTQEGAASLCLAQLFYSGDTRIMYSRSVKRPDRIKFYMEFDRESA